MSLNDLYFACVSESEGYREGIYLCSEGRMTVGYGRNLEAHPLTKEDAEMMRSFKAKGEKDHGRLMHEAWARKEIAKVEASLTACFSWFGTLPEFAKIVLVDMTYNLSAKIKDFKKMTAAMESQDWNTAADELKSSKFYAQTGFRGRRLEKMLRDGKFL